MENQKIHRANRIKKSGHIKLKSSGQLLPNNHNFQLASTELPESFFENMVLTEIDLSEDFSMDKFYKLINLYSEAMEFYTIYDPPQVKYYKGRMESLLTKRDTLIKLKKEGQNINKKEEKNINMNNNNLSLNNNSNSSYLNRSELMNKIDLRKDVLIYEDITKQVNKFMNINNNNQNSTGIDTIKKDLENQSKKWKEKLKKKKKNMLRYSYNIKMTHQKGMSLDLINSYSSDDARNIKINYNKNNDDNDLDKFNKSKNLFNQDIFEEVKEIKEENEDEIYDNDNIKEDKPEDNGINEINNIEINTDSQDINNNNININNINNKNKSIFSFTDVNIFSSISTSGSSFSCSFSFIFDFSSLLLLILFIFILLLFIFCESVFISILLISLIPLSSGLSSFLLSLSLSYISSSFSSLISLTSSKIS